MHNICCLVYNKDDPEQVKRMSELIRVCIDEAAALGYGEYRTHIGKLICFGLLSSRKAKIIRSVCSVYGPNRRYIQLEQ